MIGIFNYMGTASEQYMPQVLVCAAELRLKRQSVLLSGDDRTGEIAGLVFGGSSFVKRIAAGLPLDPDADRRYDELRASQPAGTVRRITVRK